MPYVCSEMISNKGEKIKEKLAALYVESGYLPSLPSDVVGSKRIGETPLYDPSLSAA